MNTQQIISPIDIATDGYLSVTNASRYASPKIAIATSGYIIFILLAVGGGDLYYKNTSYNFKQDDEEIMVILAAFMEMI